MSQRVYRYWLNAKIYDRNILLIREPAFLKFPKIFVSYMARFGFRFLRHRAQTSHVLSTKATFTTFLNPLLISSKIHQNTRC